MRWKTTLAAALLLPAAFGALAGESAPPWLARAADPGLTRLEREYAFQQLLMLADVSASMFVSTLASPDPARGAERRVAARLLGEIDFPSAEAPLLEATQAADYFLALAAGDSLARLYSRLDDREIHRLLKRGVPETASSDAEGGDDWLALSLDNARSRSRFRALVMRGLALKYAGNAEPMPEALVLCAWDSLLDGDRELRLAAVEAASLSGSNQAPERLAAFLYIENDPELLIAALKAMAALRPPEYGEAVERQARHADPAVALEALAALAAMGYGNAMFPVSEGALSAAGFVNHPSAPVRRRAVEILAESRDPRAAEYLAFALGDRIGPNRAAAAGAVGRLGFTAAIGFLSPLLNDPNPEARAAAALALDSLGVVGVTARMLDDLEGDDLPLRRSAAATLGRLGDRRAAGYLRKTLADPDLETAAASAIALGALGDREAGASLYRLMTGAANPALADAARRALAVLYADDDPGDSQGSRESWARRNGVP